MFALPGHQVKLAPDSLLFGYEEEKEDAKKYLAIGVMYTVKQTVVTPSHSTVELEEVPRISFNTLHFESIEEQSEVDDRKHPDFIYYFGDYSEPA
jgi:hypothetical protein